MNNKKKTILASISILFVIMGGVFLKKFYTNNKSTTRNSRVVQIDEYKDKKAIEKNKSKQKDKEKKEKEKKQDKNKHIEDKKEQDKEKDKPNNKTEKIKKHSKDKKKDSAINKAPSKPAHSKNIRKKITVNIRIEGYDKTFLPRTQVTTENFDLNPYLGSATGSSATPSKGWGIEKFKQPTHAHAVIRALNNKGFKKGKDYDFQDYGWGLYIAMIGGDREFDHRSTSGWMYRVNNVLPNIGCQGKPLEDGEEILWYFGAYGFDSLVTEMKADKTKVKVAQPITLTLKGIKNDINTWKEYREPAKKAVIYCNEAPLNIEGKKIITDNNGKSVIKFNKPGTYKLSAERINKRGLRDMVRPRPIIVTVK